MNLGILTNISSIRASNDISKRGRATNKNNNRLSSGKRLNSATDDAAGLSISSKMKAQIKSLEMAEKNTQDAKSLISTAEGGLNEISSMLNRIRELTVQAANDTNNHSDRQKIADEVVQLLNGINDVSKNVNFNEKKLLNGNFKSEKIQFQIGSGEGQIVEVNIDSMFVDDMTLQSVKEVFGAVDGKKTTRQFGSRVVNPPNNPIIHKKGTGESPEYKVGLVKVGNLAQIQQNETKLEVKITFKDIVGDEHIEILNLKIPPSTSEDNFNRAFSDALSQNSQYFFSEYDKNLGHTIKSAKKSNGVYITNFEVTGTESVGISYTGERPGSHKGKLIEYDLTTMVDGAKITLDGDVNGNPKYTYTYRTDGKADPHKGEFGDFEQFKQAAFLDGNTILGTSFANVKPLIGRKEKEFTVKYGNVSNDGKEITTALEGIDKSLDNVASVRAKLGSIENGFDFTSNSLKTSFLNLTQANSVLEDADYSKEFMENTKNNILINSATTILAQANQEPKSVLSLLDAR